MRSHNSTDSLESTIWDDLAERYNRPFSSVDLNKMRQWSEPRRLLAMTFNSVIFDSCLAVLLLLNVFVMVVETDSMADKLSDSEPNARIAPSWCEIINRLLIVTFAIELCFRIFSYRRDFFRSVANTVDFVIVGMDCVALVIAPAAPNFSLFRVFRLLRLGRFLKLLNLFPELGSMLRGLTHALRSIFWGMVMVIAMLTLWSLVAVQVIHPLNLELARNGHYENCERCHRAFESTFASLVTFTQQIVAGDSWGQVSVVIIDEHPWTYVFFVAVLASVGLGLLNLILAVIVDNSMEARKETLEAIVTQKKREYSQAAVSLEELCSSLDEDSDGVISFEELTAGFETNEEFQRSLQALDITKHDLRTVFNILDEDRSGDIEYHEFVKQIYKFKTMSSHTLEMFMQYHVEEILLRTTKQMGIIEGDVTQMLESSLRDLQSIKAAVCIEMEVPSANLACSNVSDQGSDWARRLRTLEKATAEATEVAHAALTTEAAVVTSELDCQGDRASAPKRRPSSGSLFPNHDDRNDGTLSASV